MSRLPHYARAGTWAIGTFRTLAAGRRETGGTKSWLGSGRHSATLACGRRHPCRRDVDIQGKQLFPVDLAPRRGPHVAAAEVRAALLLPHPPVHIPILVPCALEDRRARVDQRLPVVFH